MAMDIDVEEVSHGEHPSTTIRQYVMIGVILTVVTAFELWCSYNQHILQGALIPVLMVLSAFKFVVVVALFMHLKFESRLLTRLFLCGIVLATCIMLALLALFWNNDTDIVGNAGHGGQGVTAEQPKAEPK